MRAKLLIAAVLAAAVVPVTAAGAPGDLDPGFGSGGVVTTGFGTTPGPTAHDYGRAVAIQPDGKILVAGTSETSAGTKVFAVSRHTSAGAPDAGFGTGGKVTTAFTSGKVSALALALQPDGKLVVAGGVETGGTADVALARYNADGSLDTFFGTGGRVTTDLGDYDFASAAAVQSDGKIVVGGTSGAAFGLARYRPDGSLDPAFGSGGKVRTEFADRQAEVTALGVQVDGRVVAAGNADDGLDIFDVALARYTPAGVLDPSFGGGGRVTTDVSGGYDFAYAMLTQMDGRIVVSGQADVGASTRFALLRYTWSGSLDASFGGAGTGKVTTDFSDLFGGSIYTFSSARALAIQGGRYVAAGLAGVAGYRFAVARYGSDGVVDSGFGSAGRLTTNIGNFDDEARGIAVGPDGKIVAAGYSYTGSYDFALARYQVAYGSGADVYPFATSSPSPVQAGADLTYTVVARNDGPATAADVSLSDPLPAGAAFKSASPGCAVSQGTVTCSLGSIAAGSSASATIVVTPSAAGLIPITVSVSSGTPDPYPANATYTFWSRVRASVSTYGDARIQRTLSADASGNGYAVAQGSADKDTGRSTVSATARDSLPVGFVSGTTRVGSAHASFSGRVVHQFVAAGPVVTVTATMEVTSASATEEGATPSVYQIHDAVALVTAQLWLIFYPCASVGACGASANATAVKVVAEPGAAPASQVVVVASVLTPPGFGGTGVLLVDTGLYATASVWGNTSASCQGLATVTEVAVT